MADQTQTHIVTKPNARPPMPIEVLRGNMEGEFIRTVQNYYHGNEQEALRFKTAAVDYVRRVPKLLECDRISLLSAFVQSAQFRFLPSGVGGEAYIIPYGCEAKFQLGYQGIVSLLYRTGKISTITANIIFDNDEFDYQEGIEAHLIHKPAMFGKDKGKAIGVYAVVTMSDGRKTFKVMDEEMIMSIKNLSRAKASKESPWNSDKDPEKWMWRKTCLIQLAKLLPKTQELQQAIDKDYEGEGMDRGHIDAGGSAVGASFHNPIDVQPEVPAQTFKEAAHDHAEKKNDDDLPFVEDEDYTEEFQKALSKE